MVVIGNGETQSENDADAIAFTRQSKKLGAFGDAANDDFNWSDLQV